MKRASYFKHNILEQRKEVTTGENLHEIALGTDEVSDHLSAQIHKYINTHNHQNHLFFISSNHPLHWSLTILINCYNPSKEFLISISNPALGVACICF